MCIFRYLCNKYGFEINGNIVMMKTKYFLLVITLMLASQFTFAQGKNKVIIDPELKQNVMIGYVDKEGLKTGEYGYYFNSQYELYSISDKTISKLKEKMGDVAVTIVLGTWCGDSKIQVPRFIKILDAINYPADHLNMIAVDARKEGLVVDIKPFDIERVPTFIFYRNGNEIGRIIETPKKSLEKDLMKIIR